MTAVKPQRKPYVSPRRTEQLDATRRRILEAARERFNERGYTSATIAEIAATAGLAVPTVYKNFGNKRQLLLALIDQTISRRVGGELAAVMDQATPRQRIEGLAAMTVNLAGPASDVLAVAFGAARADPEFAALTSQLSESRRQNAARIVRTLAADGALAPDCTEDRARDILWLLAGPELYEQFVTRAGWSAQAFQRWLADALARLVLSPDSP
jgi:AcrR family transcriptional regulator